MLEINIAWGGYYISMTDNTGAFSVFRLLDFNRQAYHAALFTEKFTILPTLNELLVLSPFIGHAPIDAKALVGEKELQLIGSKPLTYDDLEGYMYYLNECGVLQEEIYELAEEIINFSNQPPLGAQLRIVDEKLVISEPA